jgi:Domain of unknown function (DUF4382)
MQAARAVCALWGWWRRVTLCLWLVVGLSVLLGLTGCGGGGGGGDGSQAGGATPPSTTQSGTVTVTLSDPPTCKVPRGDLNHVWVTITLVRAHLSTAADPDASGWVTLLDLRTHPVQIDLLSASETTCVLTTLGATTGVPPGDYQQLRLHLLSNTPAAGAATPGPNNCADTGGFNCVELGNGTRRVVQLSSEAQTGIKIPPGQIAGGAIRLRSAQAADLNIDFNACASIVQQGNGAFRLKPTLHAGEVALPTQAISGLVVDTTTSQPLSNATVIVLAEQPDSDGIDRVVTQTLASATQGTFLLCPLSPGTYDIVIAALTSAGVPYNATVTFGVLAGTAMGTIPLIPARGSTTDPGAIEGLVTTADGGATGADIALSALQTATPPGGAPVLMTVPLVGESTPTIATERDASCPARTGCAMYLLNVPASNPLVGTFNASGTAYAPPAGGSVVYSVNAQAFIPGNAGTPNCLPSSLRTGPVTVSAGTLTRAASLAFTGCAPGMQ